VAVAAIAAGALDVVLGSRRWCDDTAGVEAEPSGMSTDLLTVHTVPPLPRRRGPVALLSAALLLAGAGAVHLAVAPEHLQEYVPFGIFFAVVGLAQLTAGAVVLARPGRRLLVATAAAQALLVALWLASRTTGLPVGREPWSPERVGVADVVCILLEAVSVLVLAGLAVRGARPLRARRVRTPLGSVAVVAVVGVATFVGVGTGLSAMPVTASANPPGVAPGGTPLTALVAAPGAQPVEAFTLTARQATSDGHPAFTYDGTVPGPLLRVTQGDRVRVTLMNRLPVATTLHWHGVRVPGAEDGVAGITQDAVAPGDSFTYEFVASDAGTFWYHSHQDTGTQIPAGLFGALVVDPPGHPAQDVDRVVMLHDATDGSPAIAVNGTTGDLHLDARPGQTVRLRVIDAVAPGMDGTAEVPVLLGAPYRVVALDGHDLTGPQQLGPQRLQLGMGQRADLVFTMPATGAVRLVDSRIAGAPSALQGFFGPAPRADETVTIGDGPAPAPVDPASLPVFDPLAYGTPAPDPTTRAQDLTAPVVLGEGPGFHDGSVQLVHTINGAASPGVPPLIVHAGQLVGLHIINNTGEFHPMHLHGHVMTVLAVDGRRPQGSPVHLDTVLLAPHQTVDAAFPADNPGIWMLHCHVPLHAAMGMSMTIDYAGVTTPFEMGSRSGNVPE
jgi:FtsP/CotA-like multicopper oxidase with cupredoxin domain